MEQTTAKTPLWLLALQYPLTRLILLGGGLFYMMMIAEGYLQTFQDAPVLLLAVTIGMGLLGMAVYVGYAKLIERRDVNELSLPGMGREWVVGALLGAALYAGCALILIVLGIYRVEGLNPLAFMIPGLAMAIKAGIFEELVFRGVFFRSVEDMLGSWISIVASSLLFGFLHLLNPGATVFGATYISIEAGLILAAAYLVTRRLWICIGLHMGWNGVQSAVFSGTVSGGFTAPGLIRSTIEGPDLLTGGSFGMEGSVFALALCTAAGVVLLIVAIRRGHILPPSWMRRG